MLPYTYTKITKASEMQTVKTKEEIRRQIDLLEKERETRGPFTEPQQIARKAAKQALEWVLGETDSLLTYSH